jgi:L-ascorbate metabolism protein UlaG (beta-lactamase superfamily)
MRVTKYPQSCLLLERDGAGRLLIDPGNFVFEAFAVDDLGPLDAVLYTHRHPDHFDERHVDALLEAGAELYANADVCGLVGEDDATELGDGETAEIAGFEVTAHDLPHVPLVDGSPGPPNTGYLVDRRLFHPGDGVDVDLTAEVLGLPIAGPSISFRDAYAFTERLGAERVIPMHYHMFVAEPELFDRFCDIAEVVVLDDGESAEV